MRRPTPEEEALVRDSLDAVKRGLADAMIGDRVLGVYERADQTIVSLVAPAIFDLPPALLEDAEAGLAIASLDEGLGLDLQGAVVFARETRRQTVRAQEQGARMFLYGKDILGESVLEFDGTLRRGDHCIVTNPRGEGIGIGQVVGSFKGPGPAVRAVHDLGRYLRSQ